MGELSSREVGELFKITGVTELKRLRASFNVSVYFLNLGREIILLKLKVITSINRRHKFLFFVYVFCKYQPKLY